MISYRIVFSGTGMRTGDVLFDLFLYRDGVYSNTIASSLSASRAKDLVEQILAGEKEYIVVPKNITLTFN